MDVKQPQRSYTIIRPDDLPQVHRLMYQSFHLDEPMTKELGLNEGGSSIPDSDLMAESLVKDHNLSLMVLDRSTNTPLGVMLNGVFHRDEIDTPPSEVIASCIDPRFAPIASILHKVQIKSRDFFYNNNMETAFDLKMLAVHPSARGQGLARDMIERSVQLAKCLGYKMCKTEATGDFSRRAFLKAGFELVAECDYNDFAQDGERVFQNINNHKGVALLIKML